MAVGRATRNGSKYHVVNSDHYTCILTLADLPSVRKKNRDYYATQIKDLNTTIWFKKRTELSLNVGFSWLE